MLPLCNMLLKSIILITFLLSSLATQAQEDYSISDFSPISLNSVFDSSWSKLNSSNYSIEVYKISGKIKFRKFNHTKYKIVDALPGRFISINRGEFSGGLFFKPIESKLDSITCNNLKVTIVDTNSNILFMKPANPLRKMILGYANLMRGNFKEFLKFGGELYVLSGLSHLSINEGAIHKISVQNSNFIIEEVINLENEPYAYKILKKSVLLACDNKLYKITKDLKYETILNKTLWEGLEPTSLEVYKKKLIYIGITGGFVTVNLTNKSVNFYKLN